MLQRALVVFLVFVTFWSAFAVQEAPLQDAVVGVPLEEAQSASQQPTPLKGSVQDHHLDDQPGQAFVDTAQDLPAWFPVTRAPASARPARTAWSVAPDPARATGLAEVPLRPPRA